MYCCHRGRELVERSVRLHGVVLGDHRLTGAGPAPLGDVGAGRELGRGQIAVERRDLDDTLALVVRSRHRIVGQVHECRLHLAEVVGGFAEVAHLDVVRDVDLVVAEALAARLLEALLQRVQRQLVSLALEHVGELVPLREVVAARPLPGMQRIRLEELVGLLDQHTVLRRGGRQAVDVRVAGAQLVDGLVRLGRRQGDARHGRGEGLQPRPLARPGRARVGDRRRRSLHDLPDVRIADGALESDGGSGASARIGAPEHVGLRIRIGPPEDVAGWVRVVVVGPSRGPATSGRDRPACRRTVLGPRRPPARGNGHCDTVRVRRRPDLPVRSSVRTSNGSRRIIRMPSRIEPGAGQPLVTKATTAAGRSGRRSGRGVGARARVRRNRVGFGHPPGSYR